MIIGEVKNVKRYFDKDEGINKAFEFLKDIDLDNLEIGKHLIDGDKVFALVQSYDTRAESECKFESHKRYIDIQVILDGIEKIEWSPIDKLNLVEDDFSKNDKAFYKENSTSSELILHSGNFVVFYPEDGHRACIQVNTPSHVKKVVLKVELNN
ncbi:toxin-antitoxin biofilm protein TabA [Clostridium ragsdalei P11]|uniref:Toxin-antitoxin biofilm protein TabA n=1 Tax=Clostridium ragsdalei P11 TaxID=1353534 RepID=A0A1A6APA7_9CLOT|nr:YhcH/YjgK/YiaL family protein [Clostridium ragsdalei]OBR91911.1 toxin-antitoxin biofilm protein TabA [Clostridium ragsdalei P11]